MTERHEPTSAPEPLTDDAAARLTHAMNVMRADTDRIVWFDGQEYVNVDDAAHLRADAVARARAEAWDEGHRGLCRRHGVAPFAACRNPYRAGEGR